MKLTKILLLLLLLLLLLELLELLVVLLSLLFLPLFSWWLQQWQQQKQQQLQQQLQQQQHLCLNEKLILIQLNLISIAFVFLNIFEVSFVSSCGISAVAGATLAPAFEIRGG